MHVASVSPNEDIRIELVILKGKGEYVELGHYYWIVVLKRKLRVMLIRKGRILHSFLSQFLYIWIVP